MGQIKNIKLHIVTDIKAVAIRQNATQGKKSEEEGSSSTIHANCETNPQEIRQCFDREATKELWNRIRCSTKTRPDPVCAMAQVCETAETEANLVPTIEGSSINQPVSHKLWTSRRPLNSSSCCTSTVRKQKLRRKCDSLNSRRRKPLVNQKQRRNRWSSSTASTTSPN